MHSLDSEVINYYASGLDVHLPQVPMVSSCDGEHGFVTHRLKYRCEGLTVINPFTLLNALQSRSARRTAGDQYPRVVFHQSDVVDRDCG